MKIIDIIDANKLSYSFEFFPPRDEISKKELYENIDYLKQKFKPLFIDITWGAGGRTSETTVETADFTQNHLNIETQIHLTCVDIDNNKIKETLDKCKENNVSNILALRGDFPNNREYVFNKNFQYSKDLVRFIRSEYGNFFGISVAGYPEGHSDYNKDLVYLKEKIDTGADFVITQLFFDVDLYIKYIKDLDNIGLTCPVIPGIFPIVNYNNFKRIQKLCNIKVPDWILVKLEEIKDDNEKVIDFGIQVAAEMCKKLYDIGTKSFHFYTLNKTYSIEQVIQKLENYVNFSEN